MTACKNSFKIILKLKSTQHQTQVWTPSCPSTTIKGDTVCWDPRRWQMGGYICSCVHSNLSLATFHASIGKQQKWINWGGAEYAIGPTGIDVAVQMSVKRAAPLLRMSLPTTYHVLLSTRLTAVNRGTYDCIIQPTVALSTYTSTISAYMPSVLSDSKTGNWNRLVNCDPASYHSQCSSNSSDASTRRQRCCALVPYSAKDAV